MHIAQRDIDRIEPDVPERRDEFLVAVRALGVPTNKELGAMLWGETADRLLFYSVGVFNGDGQNRPNFDDQAEVMGRVFTHPISSGPPSRRS